MADATTARQQQSEQLTLFDPGDAAPDPPAKKPKRTRQTPKPAATSEAPAPAPEPSLFEGPAERQQEIDLDRSQQASVIERMQIPTTGHVSSTVLMRVIEFIHRKARKDRDDPKYGWAWPGQPTIATYVGTNCSVRTVKRAIRVLEKSLSILEVRRPKARRRELANEYRICFPNLIDFVPGWQDRPEFEPELHFIRTGEPIGGHQHGNGGHDSGCTVHVHGAPVIEGQEKLIGGHENRFGGHENPIGGQGAPPSIHPSIQRNQSKNHSRDGVGLFEKFSLGKLTIDDLKQPERLFHLNKLAIQQGVVDKTEPDLVSFIGWAFYCRRSASNPIGMFLNGLRGDVDNYGKTWREKVSNSDEQHALRIVRALGHRKQPPVITDDELLAMPPEEQEARR